MDKKKLLNMFVILAFIIIIASSLRKLSKQNSITLTDYAGLHSASVDEGNQNPSVPFDPVSPEPPDRQAPSVTPSASVESDQRTPELTGAALNSSSQQSRRTVLADGFYYETVSDALRRYMTGVSYIAKDDGDAAGPEVSFEELRYVHILHYGFDGLIKEGELICNESIAQDITEIFYELYRNEYKLERVLLIDEYDGDPDASAAANNTFCFGLCPAEDSANPKHGAGMAIDINPLYNPCITYGADGKEDISPDTASVYADRSAGFPYKIDESDLCYKLFTQYGFTWGGNMNDKKAYQHFQKTLAPQQAEND